MENKNKRKNARIRANLAVLFKVKNTLLAGGSRIKDVSETGMCIPSKHNFPVDSLLELEIRSDDLQEPIKASAAVVRVTRRNDSEFPYELGIIFLDIPFDKWKMLQDYIRRSIAQGKNKDINLLE